MAILMIGFSGLGPLMAKRLGPHATLATGVLLGGAGPALIAKLVSISGGYLSVLPQMMVIMGLSMAPAIEAITSPYPQTNRAWIRL